MATVEQCLYCFETLAATLEKRPAMTLEEIEESWAEYPKGVEETSDEDEADDAPPSVIRPEFRANLSPVSMSSQASSKPASTFSSKPSTPLSNNSSAPPSRPPTAAQIVKEPAYKPIGQGRRSAQSRPIETSPLFVTWNKISRRSRNRSLRGCIGTFEPQDLNVGLKEYALIAALHDNRFNKIALVELPRLEVAVTLLTDFEQCEHPMDWELGVHGMKITFFERHRPHSATYLPDVAVEQGWTKDETLDSLVRKAGYTGKKQWNELTELKVVKYQGRKESVEHEEYREWREWAESEKLKKEKK